MTGQSKSILQIVVFAVVIILVARIVVNNL